MYYRLQKQKKIAHESLTPEIDQELRLVLIFYWLVTAYEYQP